MRHAPPYFLLLPAFRTFRTFRSPGLSRSSLFHLLVHPLVHPNLFLICPLAQPTFGKAVTWTPDNAYLPNSSLLTFLALQSSAVFIASPNIPE
jgi:hypothetical protein